MPDGVTAARPSGCWSNVKAALGKLFVPLTRKVNGKALTKDVTLTGENIAVSTTDSTPISGAVKYLTNPNLLDNWYFGRPVNQRGQTEYTGGGYTIDRWRAGYDGTFTVNVSDTGVSLVSGNDGSYKNFSESIETSKLIVGRTYTFSFLAEDNGGVHQIYISDYGSVFDGDKGLYTITFVAKETTRNQDFGIQTNIGKTCIPLAAKLELGDTQTLAHKENGVWVLNEIPDFGEQLRRCQRYSLYFEGGVAYGWTYSTNTVNVFIPTPVTMRAVPSLVLDDKHIGAINTVNGYVDITSIGDVRATSNGVSVDLNNSNSTFTIGTPVAWFGFAGHLTCDL
ncbi:MAG: hypothetical protein ACLUT5_12745 [Butyricicoccus sp.]